MMAAWSRLLNALVGLLQVLAALVGTSVVVLIFLEVVLRFLGAQVPPVFEETGSFFFVWWVFLGAAIAVHHQEHPRVSAIVQYAPAQLRKELLFASELVCLAYFLWLAKLGYEIAFEATQPSLSLGIPMTVPYLALGVGGTLMLILHLGVLSHSLRLSWSSLLTAAAVLAFGYASYLLAQISVYACICFVAAILFAISVPVAVVLGAVTLIALGSSDPATMINYVIRLFDGLNNFILLSIPLFMLTGVLMTYGGISARLVSFASALVGWIRGGLGLADIVASVFFADVSGSAVSDTAAIGSIMIPGLVQRGYGRPFATALQAASGSLGMLFPPSITMILYAWVANVSVARLFVASFLPGLLVATTFAAVTYGIAQRRQFPREPRAGLAVVGREFVGAIPALLAPAIILGGILTGLFTATEAGVIAAVYAFLIGISPYGELTVRTIWRAWNEATVSMSRIIFIAGNAIAFSWVLIINEGPQRISDVLLGATSSSVVALILINIFLVILHVFLEGASTVVAIVPVFLPILAQLHVDPVYFGILVMLNSAAGLLMPPVGLCLYISCSISGERLETVSREVLPFVAALFANIGLLIALPWLVDLLPRLIMGPG